MAKVLFVLPDPGIGPDRWTQRTFELRNEATIRGRCPVCSARSRNRGIDHQEIRHGEITHAASCRCSDEQIHRHLEHRGLAITDERYVFIEVDTDDEAVAP